MLVIDTNVIDAALRSSTGASHFILTQVLQGNIKACASTALYLEYEDVLKREDHLLAFQMTINDVDVILTALAARLIPVPIRYLWRPQLPDEKDDMVLECAINGQAKTLLTFNLKDFALVKKDFGIDVVRPGDFLKRLTQ